MPVRGIGYDDNFAQGFPLVTTENYTLATYTAAGTTVPAVGDIVSFSSGANNRVVRAANDGSNVAIGRVKSVNTVDLTVAVEWLNVFAFVSLPCDDVGTSPLGNAAIKDGDTTVAANFDAGAALGNMIVVGESVASGAGYLRCAVVIAGIQ